MSVRKVILLLLLLLPMLAVAQRRVPRRIVQESWDRQVINKYFRDNKPATIVDSAFYEAYQYLNYKLSADTANLTFSKFLKVIRDNRPETEYAWLRTFRDTVAAKNERFSKEMTDVRMKWHMKRMLDTMDVSSVDSTFGDILDLLNDNVNYDSLVALTTPYTDTLVKALDENLRNIRKLQIFNNIRQLRGDTTNLYIVNINGDSLKLRLFNNNPHIVHTTIKNIAGDDEPALIRDIQKNSFRLLINNSPEFDTYDDKKTKELFYNLLKQNKTSELVIKNIVPPEDPKVWKLGGKVAFDITQIALHNWVKGGENTITLLSTLELFANYAKGPHVWENNGVFKYGAIQQGKKTLRTNEDKINLTSTYGYKAFKKFYYSAQVEFKSQFAPKYDYNDNTKTRLASKFMAPATLTIGAGMEYKPNKKNSLTVTPLTSKNTFVASDTVNHKNYNVDEDKIVRSETGLYVKWIYKNRIWKNIEINSTAEFFSNYFEKPENVDVDWNLELIFPINDYVRATITTETIYDDDQEIPVKDDKGTQTGTTKGLQFKELLKLGVVFRF